MRETFQCDTSERLTALNDDLPRLAPLAWVDWIVGPLKADIYWLTNARTDIYDDDDCTFIAADRRSSAQSAAGFFATKWSEMATPSARPGACRNNCRHRIRYKNTTAASAWAPSVLWTVYTAGSALTRGIQAENGHTSWSHSARVYSNIEVEAARRQTVLLLTSVAYPIPKKLEAKRRRKARVQSRSLAVGNWNRKPTAGLVFLTTYMQKNVLEKIKKRWKRKNVGKIKQKMFKNVE